MANGIPSGGSPLYLGDFATPMTAMTQKMISTMLDRHDKKQEELSKEQEWFLKNLDFTTVENLSDEMTQELLQRQNEIEDKWTQEYMENDLQLSDEKKLQMRKDMRKYEQYAARLKSDVSAAAFAQKELASPDAHKKYDVVEGHNRMGKWRESGGKEINAHEILVPRVNTDALIDEWTEGWDSSELYAETRYKDYSTGTEYRNRSNKQNIQQKRQALEQDPDFKRLISHPQYGPEIRAGLERKMNSITNEVNEPWSISASEMNAYDKNQKIANLPEDLKKKLQKYPQWQGLDPEEIPNAEYYNDFVERFYSYDEKAFELLKTKNLTGFGVPVYISRMKNGYIRMQNDKGELREFPPMDRTDEDNIRQSKTAILSLIPPTMEGKQIPDNLQSWLIPRYDVKVDKVKPVVQVEVIQEAFEKHGTDMTKDRRKDIADEINELFPDVEKKAEIERAFFGNKERLINWDGKPYDLAKKEDQEKLLSDMNKKLGVKEEPADEDSGYSTGGLY